MHDKASAAAEGSMPSHPRPPGKRVLLAQPRGYCAGVDRAVVTVEQALEKHGPPVYVRHEIVHNRHVVSALRARGAIFVKDTDEVPRGSVMILSAHGVSPSVRTAARQRGLQVIDATCPLVTKVHNEVNRFARRDYDILLIGHDGHEEVEGTRGEAPENVQVVDGDAAVDDVVVRDESKVIWLSQTTLSVDQTMATVNKLRQRFPLLQDPPGDDICYATQNRQVAVKALAPQCDLVIVVGSHTSSNSIRLVEVALQAGAPEAYRVDDAGEIELELAAGSIDSRGYLGCVGPRNSGARRAHLAGGQRIRRRAARPHHPGICSFRAPA